MKTFAYLFLILFPVLGMAQKLNKPRTAIAQKKSYFGNVHTPKGDLHMLVIFIRYDDAQKMKNFRIWPDKTEEGVLPKIAEGEINQLFHTDPNTIATTDVRNVSDYFYRMSGGNFRITADVFPIQVPVHFIPENRGNFFRRQGEMNKAAIQWIVDNYPDFDWGKYDRRKNSPNYLEDNSESGPDKILDYIVFMHRASGSTGMGASSSIDIPNSEYKIRTGHTGIKSYSDAKHNWEYFKHEFAHNLYGCPHYLGANSADGTRMYTQKGWGLMAAWHSAFFTANAWESWWLGWLDAQEITSDGSYQLKDYLTGRDAIRIKIPGTQDYLWIENHQKKDPWDEKLFFKNEKIGHPQSVPGLYMYVVAEPGSDRNKPQLNPFNKSHANLIKMLNAEGNADYHSTGDSMKTEYFLAPLIERKKLNPIAGQNPYQFIRADFNEDGAINVGMTHGNTDGGGREQHDIWTELINGERKYTLSSTGDENDALTEGDEVGLSGIFPVVNYPQFDRKKQKLAPYYLNGITIKVGPMDSDGTYSLDIKLNDWEVRNDQRWCGNLLLSGADFVNSMHSYLQIENGATVTMDLSGTPDREKLHPETQTFANPTHLEVQGNRGIRIKSGGTLIIEEWSELILQANSQLIVEKGGVLIVRGKGKLMLNDYSQLIVKKKGKVFIEVDGILRDMKDTRIQVARGGKFKRK